MLRSAAKIVFPIRRTSGISLSPLSIRDPMIRSASCSSIARHSSGNDSGG